MWKHLLLHIWKKPAARQKKVKLLQISKLFMQNSSCSINCIQTSMSKVLNLKWLCGPAERSSSNLLKCLFLSVWWSFSSAHMHYFNFLNDVQCPALSIDIKRWNLSDFLCQHKRKCTSLKPIINNCFPLWLLMCNMLMQLLAKAWLTSNLRQADWCAVSYRHPCRYQFPFLVSPRACYHLQKRSREIKRKLKAVPRRTPLNEDLQFSMTEVWSLPWP